MKNNECTIYFTNKQGKVMQTFRKYEDGWKQTSSRGIVRHVLRNRYYHIYCHHLHSNMLMLWLNPINRRMSKMYTTICHASHNF